MIHAHIVLGGPENTPLEINPDEQNLFVGVDRGALRLVERGVEPDLAIGDFDSITIEERHQVESRAHQFEAFQAEKDDTDAELGLQQTIERFEPDQITLYNWTGGRIDHFMSLLFLAYQPRFRQYISKIRLINKENTIRYYLPGEYTIHKEEDKKYLSYIGLTPISGLTLKDVKYTLEDAEYTYPIALISNEFVESEATFSFSKGIVAVVQATDK